MSAEITAPITFETNKTAFANEATRVAELQLEESSNFKEPRMEQIRKYEDLYLNKVEPKLRQQFNVPVPVMSGLVDTLLANIDDPIRLKFKEQDPSDYSKIKKINAAWEIESVSNRPTAKWDQKDRWGKKLSVFSGRAIYKYYASSNGPTGYQSNLEVVDHNDFHCEPKGGGHLENHMFAGQEGIFRTKEDLERGVENGVYDATQVKELLDKAGSTDYKTEVTLRANGKFNRFQALGLEPESNNYVGSLMFNLVEWAMVYKGERWYLVFDPITRIWIRFEKLETVFSTGYYPWVSWATHEDPKVFWSKSYADDFYPVADAVITLFNQELTNRQKKNFHARAYDPEIFTDPEQLDAANFRPDALVKATTAGGTRAISSGIYEFQVGDLGGTVDLINYINAYTGQQTGVTPQTSGVAEKDKKVNVLFAEMDAVNKRFSYRSESYSEAWGEIGIRYVQGLRDHLGESLAIQLMGENGIEWDELKRIDLTLARELDVTVISSSKQNRDSVMKAESRMKALGMLDPNFINPRWKNEQILRDVGNYPDDEIAMAMDTQNFASKELSAEASSAIQLIMLGKEPELNYDATTGFLQKILNFATAHRMALGAKKYGRMMDYIMAHAQIVTENMARKAMIMRMGMPTPGVEDPGGAAATGALPGGNPVPKQITAPAPQPIPVQ